MLILAIIGLSGLTIGFFAGAGYATRGASNHRDEAERYAAECHTLRAQLDQLRRSTKEPSSGIVSKEQIDELRAMTG